MVIREVLPNGVTLITDKMAGVRSVGVGVWVRRGSRHESSLLAGISNFSHRVVLTRLASHYQHSDVAFYVLGSAEKEYVYYHCTTIDKHLKDLFGFLAKLILNPVFSDDALEREKAQAA